ncbi:MAG: NAD-dependent deacylase [Anaerolineae bacterium]|nr:NAD-dependent deacylase [Anaerolineae bacterium]
MKREERIERAASLICRARHAIALTGAGISTHSGVPDFRSTGSGLWEAYNPMEVASIHAFRRHPDVFYRWVQPMVRVMWEAQPNPAHVGLAQLEQMGLLAAVLTQNIDNLHQRAGSRVVFELHGHLREVTCLDCFRVWAGEAALQTALRGDVPRCAACGGVVKPNVILFGEQLPSQVLSAAMEHARQADLVIVAGSSLTVMPVAKIPALVHSRGGHVIVINNQPTYADAFAAAVFRENLEEVIPELVQACRVSV